MPPGDVSGGQSPNKTMDLLARQMPGTRATPTPLPDRLHLALVGKDDGSLQAKLPQITLKALTSFSSWTGTNYRLPIPPLQPLRRELEGVQQCYARHSSAQALKLRLQRTQYQIRLGMERWMRNRPSQPLRRELNYRLPIAPSSL